MQEGKNHLLSEYFTRNLSEPELQDLKNQLEAHPEDRKLLEDYRQIWETSGQNREIEPIDVEGALIRTKRRLFFTRSRLFKIMQQAAAVLILAVLLSTAYLHYFQPAPVSLQGETPGMMQEVSTIFGTRSKFKLSDGTLVSLNSGSRLVFPVGFSGATRHVELTGEAFFEVTPNPERPFIVKASEINVRVLGTSFNLQAYPGSGEINTTLIHGKVVLETESGGKTEKLAELNPSERAIFHLSAKTMAVSKEESVDKYIAWKDGKLVFYNDPIEKVAEKLGNWYNVTVKINRDELKRYRFTATFRDEPIEQVLELLCKSSPIKYQIKRAVRLADDSYSKREIIIN
jgi:ferric-dicitrate binding protein FerR (iron transport regulator)